MKENFSPINPPMLKGRLETLADGIFAIAMTLLILSIELPNASLSSVLDFRVYILQLIPQILIYFISFILLAIFWLNHHLLFAIKKANLVLMWINIIWLMFIALVPFTTQLVTKGTVLPFSNYFRP
ncbi:MAG: TMEM175 family protein [Methanobacterium sp.]